MKKFLTTHRHNNFVVELLVYYHLLPEGILLEDVKATHVGGYTPDGEVDYFLGRYALDPAWANLLDDIMFKKMEDLICEGAPC